MASYVFPVDNWQTGDGVKYTGRRLRQMLGLAWFGRKSSRLLGVRSGVPADTPPSIITATALAWTINPHGGVVDAEASTIAGPYWYTNDAAVTGAMNAPHATLPRVDLISVQISDPSEGDSTSAPGVAFVYTAGTAASSPTAPATPARAMALAQINVASAADGSPPSVTFVAPWQVATGGILPIRNAAERAALTPYAQQYIGRLDTGALEYWDGTQWQIAHAPDPGYTNLTGWASGAGPGPAGNYTPGYKQLSTARVRMRGVVAAGSSFAAGGVVIIPALPGAIIPAKTVLFPVATQYGSGITVNSDLQIGNDGTMQLFCGPGCTAFSLHGIEYDLA